MRVPGGNVLRLAQTVLGTQTILWYRNTGRTTNAIGLDVSTFGYPTKIRCSVQPVPRALMQQMGLDFNKEYVTVFAISSLQDIDRDRSGDQFSFNNFMYQVLSNTEWKPIDGWNETMAVKIGPVVK